MSDAERRSFVAPAAAGDFDGIDLGMLDPSDPDDRRILILAEHPELHRAITAGRSEIHVGGEAINPSLHVAMHEIVANQLWDDQPPETWKTARRLVDAGYDRHEILHMLASVVSADVYRVMHDGESPDPDKTRSALAALPESWERQRADSSIERHQNRAERRAAARKPHR